MGFPRPAAGREAAGGTGELSERAAGGSGELSERDDLDDVVDRGESEEDCDPLPCGERGSGGGGGGRSQDDGVCVCVR